jgi:hypothetical protein
VRHCNLSVIVRCYGIPHSPSSGEGEPQNKDELECVVKWEPVNGTDGTLKHREECEHDPVLEQRSQPSQGGRREESEVYTVSHWESSLLPAVNKASRE